MTENERFTYFQQLGFEGAYILWEQADRELDKIFDMESDDSHLIQEMINTYKDKYSDIFLLIQLTYSTLPLILHSLIMICPYSVI